MDPCWITNTLQCSSGPPALLSDRTATTKKFPAKVFHTQALFLAISERIGHLGLAADGHAASTVTLLRDRPHCRPSSPASAVAASGTRLSSPSSSSSAAGRPAAACSIAGCTRTAWPASSPWRPGLETRRPAVTSGCRYWPAFHRSVID